MAPKQTIAGAAPEHTIAGAVGIFKHFASAFEVELNTDFTHKKRFRSFFFLKSLFLRFGPQAPPVFPLP